MRKLHLGVVDVPYTSDLIDEKWRKPATTTGDVASILEDKYGIMLAYFNNNKSKIIDSMEKSISNELQSIISGNPPAKSPLLDTESFIEKTFKDFLSSSEVEKVGIPGVPTKAALDGISHRFRNPRYMVFSKGKKKKLVRRPRRPSFIDTSLYQSSMKAWFE